MNKTTVIKTYIERIVVGGNDLW